jgi:hypothetical protein
VREECFEHAVVFARALEEDADGAAKVVFVGLEPVEGGGEVLRGEATDFVIRERERFEDAVVCGRGADRCEQVWRGGLDGELGDDSRAGFDLGIVSRGRVPTSSSA